LIDSDNVTNKNKLWRKIQNQENINGWNWEKVEEKEGGNGKERKKREEKNLLHCSYEYINRWGGRPIFLLMDEIEEKNKNEI